MKKLTKTKNKTVRLLQLLEKMGMENFGKYIRGNGEVFILRSLENLPDWKPINIGVTQTNRLKGRILQTGKILNIDDSPYWAILNVMFKKNIKYMADLVYKEEKIFTEGKFRTSANIAWKFEDNSQVAVTWAKKELKKEKAINKLANETWQEWIIAEKIREYNIKIAPQRAKKERVKREKRNKNKQEKLDNELFAALV